MLFLQMHFTYIYFLNISLKIIYKLFRIVYNFLVSISIDICAN